MVLLKIKRKSRVPIYQQIIDQIIEMISQNTLEEGMNLPSSRALAAKLGLDRTTVYHAYQELIARGYIGSTPGSYSRVRKRPAVASPERKSEMSLIDWAEKSSRASDSLYKFFLNYSPEKAVRMPSDMINLSPLNLDHRVFPADDFRRSINQVLVNEGPEILAYGDYAGYTPLREYVAQRMKIHGVSIFPEEILITNGAQQAIDLVLNLFARPGAKVAIETPTYANVIPLMRYHQMNIIEIPMNNDGMNLNFLRQKFQSDPPDFIYTIPNFHNPTGITTSQVHREELLHICEKHRIPIIEDGFEEEMKYFGKIVLPIKSMDKNQIVIYLGTFSKVLFPGIRIGWIAAEKECLQRIIAIKRFSDLSSSTLIQAALNSFCRQGYYDLHIKRMHRIFRKRMQIALQTMDAHFPEGVQWTKPDGGYTIWVKLPKPYHDENMFKDLLIKNGVLVSPGEYYFHGKTPKKYFRISISSLTEDEIEEGILRLGQALRQFNEVSV